MVKHRRIVLVRLTILWDWCLIGLTGMLFLVILNLHILVTVKPKKKLAMMYLANDILQNSRRKGPEYNREFAIALPDALVNFVK